MESQLHYDTSFSTILRNNLPSSNLTTDSVNTTHAVSVFGGCEQMVSGIIFDLTMQSFNVIIGIPANILVLANLIKTRNEPLTSDIFLGCWLSWTPTLDSWQSYHSSISTTGRVLWVGWLWSSHMVWRTQVGRFPLLRLSGPLYSRYLPHRIRTVEGHQIQDRPDLVVLLLTFAYASPKLWCIHNFEKVSLVRSCLPSLGWWCVTWPSSGPWNAHGPLVKMRWIQWKKGL